MGEENPNASEQQDSNFINVPTDLTFHPVNT